MFEFHTWSLTEQGRKPYFSFEGEKKKVNKNTSGRRSMEYEYGKMFWNKKMEEKVLSLQPLAQELMKLCPDSTFSSNPTSFSFINLSSQSMLSVSIS